MRLTACSPRDRQLLPVGPRRNHILRAVVGTAELAAEVSAAGGLLRHAVGRGGAMAANARVLGFRSWDAALWELWGGSQSKGGGVVDM
jgi:hypothetical protein